MDKLTKRELDDKLSAYWGPEEFPGQKAASFRAALEAGADPNAGCWGGRTPLTGSIAFGRLDCVRVLLEFGADWALCERETGLTPAGLAASRGDVEALALLEEFGDDFSAPSAWCPRAIMKGIFPEHALVLRDSLWRCGEDASILAPALAFLAARVGLERETERGVRPLGLALDRGERKSMGLAMMMLSLGADWTARDGSGFSARDRARDAGPEVVGFLESWMEETAILAATGPGKTSPRLPSL